MFTSEISTVITNKSKRIVEESQTKLQRIVEEAKMSAFGKRLKEAFGTESVAEIARKMGVSYQACKNYVEGRIPDADKLREISDSTNCSIHWLLTGEGSKFVNAANQLTLDEIFENKIREIVREEVASEMKKERGRPSLTLNLNNSEEDRKAA